MDSRPTRLGKFELLARIAKGGMAEIFLARQHSSETGTLPPGVGLSRLAVVKRILPHLAEEQTFVEMFLEEARYASLIAHPNVVQIYDFGECAGEFYIAMEYIDGPSIGLLAREARRNKEPLSPVIAAEIIAQAADGLHAAHELRDEEGQPLGLVHRDVSPHNLMLTKGGTIKLLDFGVAKAHDSAIQTNTGSVKGKFPYMSPEQCRGDDLDRRTDIFSLGIVFWELCCAERLFQRSTDLMTLKAITEDPLPAPRDRNPSLPESLSEVLRYALARDREARYATAAELAHAIRNVLTGLGERGGAEILAGYINERYGQEMEARAAKLREVSRKPTGARVPVVRGFDHSRGRGSEAGSHASATGRGSASYFATSTVDRVSSHVADLSSLPSGVFTVDERPPRTGTSGGARLRRTWLWIAIATVLLGLGAGLVYRFIFAHRERPPGPALRFGMAPVFAKGSLKQQRHFGDLLRYLERTIDRRVELAITKTYGDLAPRLVSGDISVASMSPLQFVRMRNAHPEVPMLAAVLNEGSSTYQAYLLVRTDSAIRALKDARGTRICYVDRGSASGYLMARYYLRQKGLDPERDFSTTVLSGSHEQVLRDLIAGRCDIGATFSEAYRNARKLKIPSSALKILCTTADLPLDVVCASPKLSTELRRKLKEALLAFVPQRDLGRAMVSDLFPITRFVIPSPKPFEALRAANAAERKARGSETKGSGTK
ncbi:MAG: hypothetical protein CSA65_07190 [Proteobacteria bacterium]|nr:MAG: hypothetical protein CSB49_00665 [Pseudomonadota bacterium]PIE17932.1 MAG: hypothetical protein CSA65_07190 [Pseudomonadota bacterium]